MTTPRPPRSIAIPQRTQQGGTTATYGPFTLPTGYDGLQVVFDRTVAGGLNSLPDTTLLTIVPQVSYDGGTTWTPIPGLSQMPGGVYTDDGRPVNSASCGGAIDSPTQTGRQARAVVTVEGPSPVVLAGQIILD